VKAPGLPVGQEFDLLGLERSATTVTLIHATPPHGPTSGGSTSIETAVPAHEEEHNHEDGSRYTEARRRKSASKQL